MKGLIRFHIDELNLSENNLKSLPNSIGNFKSLVKFELRSNKFNMLPDSIGELECLKSLILDNNQLESLPWNIRRLKGLKYLYLEKNPWKGEWKELISKDIPTLLELCKKKATIYIFISHTVAEFDKYNIKQLADFLELQE
ncbi:MAG: leucine-rich repeat domain-containing protein, partial [Promethearchaeota archaeon]